jgi:hypothetical protein
MEIAEGADELLRVWNCLTAGDSRRDGYRL